MKKVFKIFLRFFLVILGLLLCLIIFLLFYYGVLEKKQISREKMLAGRSVSVVIPSDQGIRSQTAGLNLLPVPRKIQIKKGYFKFPSLIVFSVIDSLQTRVKDYLKMIPESTPKYSATGENIQFRFMKGLPLQGYTLDIRPDKIIAGYSTLQGMYYAIVSLKVLKHNYNGIIPCVYIEDSPDLQVRGLMLDISRDKVPTRETLFGILSLIADLKYNHFELYIEGFSFAYPSFKELWEGKETPVTGGEIQSLDTFCRAHFIDFVPNQNSLGHMMAWLATDRFKDLAECPKGYKIMGLINMKGTLYPGDARSLELILKMSDDLLPNFSSSNFNVNLDEPFELGKGKSKELCEKKGEGQVYLDYAIKLHDILAAKNKKMLMWGDIVMRHPELIPNIPKDITLLDWGYESSYPYERHCKTLQASGLSYMVCPGTNSWTSITGRTDNMLATIEVATTNGAKYGAKGMLLTDWGDMGHWQYLPVSYAGYAAGGALSWNSKSRKDLQLGSFLNSYIFNDESSLMGDLVLDLGRYNMFEEVPMFNMTTTMMSFQFGMRDKIMTVAILDKVISGINDLMKDIAPEMINVLKNRYDERHPFDYKGLQSFLDSKEVVLNKVRLKTADSLLIRDEYMNAIRLIRMGECLQSYISFRSKLDRDDEKQELKTLRETGKKYLEENHRLWLIRNKSGGYDRSIAILNILIQQIDDRLLMLNKSAFAIHLNRLLEKIGTA